jgi:hypothetical protein
MRHEEKKQALDGDASEQVSGRRSAFRLPLGALDGDSFEQSGIVRFTDRKRYGHPGIDVSPCFVRVLLVQRHWNERTSPISSSLRAAGRCRSCAQSIPHI